MWCDMSHWIAPSMVQITQDKEGNKEVLKGNQVKQYEESQYANISIDTWQSLIGPQDGGAELLLGACTPRTNQSQVYGHAGNQLMCVCSSRA